MLLTRYLRRLCFYNAKIIFGFYTQTVTKNLRALKSDADIKERSGW